MASELRDVQILLRVDNTTALSYLNKMGGVIIDTLSALSRKIWQCAGKRNIILFASYIASKENTIADELSRISQDDIEWELNDEWFQIVIEKFGQPSIDLFASASNRKCERFVAWKPQKGAYCIDAFTLNWFEEYFYAFSPFALILKSLVKIKRENAIGIIVVPLWKNQPWFPFLEQLVTGEAIVFEPNAKMLLSSCRKKAHPQAQFLRLIVANKCAGSLLTERRTRRGPNDNVSIRSRFY